MTGLKDKLFFYSKVSSIEIWQIWWFDVTKDDEALTLSQSKVISLINNKELQKQKIMAWMLVVASSGTSQGELQIT